MGSESQAKLLEESLVLSARITVALISQSHLEVEMAAWLALLHRNSFDVNYAFPFQRTNGLLLVSVQHVNLGLSIKTVENFVLSGCGSH